ncbi:MAG: DUF2855 family protein [Acidobacteriota bacterium]
MEQLVDFEVDRRDHGTTRVVVRDRWPTLAKGQVLFAIDRFALTANNITYALIGDQLDYWGFFPADGGWGRIPAMGWADVIESNHPEIEVGGRYFGWYPMSSHVVVQAAPSSSGLLDDSPRRAHHAPIYRSFQETSRDPFYQSEHEDRHALLRGLFVTAFLADDFLFDHDFFGSERTVVLSASSKTAIGFARQSHARGRHTVGVTSERNVEFVRGLGLYDEVTTYGEIEGLEAGVDTVVVDMAGNGEVLRRVHQQLGSSVRYSMGIGLSHGDAAQLEAEPGEVLPGPQQEFFFAPSQVEKRLHDWGSELYTRRIAEALGGFVESSPSWLEIEHSRGGEELTATYRSLLLGRLTPKRGHLASLG